MKKLSRFLLMILLSGVPLSFAQAPPSKPDQSAADYDVQDPVWIRMRDGTSLSAIVVRLNVSSEPLPAVLFYTTYDQGSRDSIFGKKSADRGYVGIVAYSRAKTDLDEYVPYEHDGNDIYDVIEWISKQSWCNGKVGMYGGSYTGFSQWATAKNVHPALKTIVPQVAVMPGYDTPTENNVCSTSLCLGWPNDLLKNSPLPGDLFDRWYAAGTSYRALDTFAERPNRIFRQWLEHPAYDDYWRSLAPSAGEYARITIPVLTTTGYYDGDQIGALRYLKLHYKYNHNADHYLVIGPYDHRGGQRNSVPTLLGYNIDPIANVSMEELALQWLDFVLKGGEKPRILKDKINYEVMGANEWRHAPSLYKISNKTLTLYLSSAVTGGDHVLSPEKPKKLDFLEETVDFKDRASQNNLFTPTIINTSPASGLVFITAPFTQPFSINGSFAGQINASINKRDMDVSIAFYELMPDGTYFYLTRYLGRASYSRDKSMRHLLRPQKKEAISLGDVRMISKQINKGSRLVIVLDVNKNPFEIIDYGSGKDVNDETISDAGAPLRVKWFNDSFVKVPIWQ